MRCIVKDCKNHEHEGKFIGSLCFPCYAYITTGRGEYSQAFRNAQRTWVGLTDEDAQDVIKRALQSLTDDSNTFKLSGNMIWVAIVKEVEAALRSKNT